MWYQIEGLVDEMDFKSVMTRQEFEALFVADQPKFTQPILDALSNANLTMVRRSYLMCSFA